MSASVIGGRRAARCSTNGGERAVVLIERQDIAGCPLAQRCHPQYSQRGRAGRGLTAARRVPGGAGGVGIAAATTTGVFPLELGTQPLAALFAQPRRFLLGDIDPRR